MKAFIIFNILKNFYFHLGWDLCLSNIFYKQISRPKCTKLTKFMAGVSGNSCYPLSRKIPGSRDFTKSRPGNPRIENSWSRWSLLARHLSTLFITSNNFAKKRVTHAYTHNCFFSAYRSLRIRNLEEQQLCIFKYDPVFLANSVFNSIF